jgi:hypothetical protein
MLFYLTCIYQTITGGLGNTYIFNINSDIYKKINKAMAHIFTYEQFLNESVSTGLVLSEIIDNEIRVYKHSIEELFSFVGEGIDEIEPIDISSTAKVGNKFITYLTNAIKITFIDNAWGGISLEEWNKCQEILESFLGIEGYEDYAINPSTNTITLIFNEDIEMGLY